MMEAPQQQQAAGAAPPPPASAAPPPAAAAAAAARQPLAPGPAAKPGGVRRKNVRGRTQEEERVKLGPEVARGSERLRTGWRPVQLSAEDKAADLELDERQLGASSAAGYKMARATHGAYQGTWYFEVSIGHLGPSGAARLGWASRAAELNGPVGADGAGYAYRSLEGSKVHNGWRDSYGEPYGEGDVIGCLLHLPPGGRPLEKGPEDAVKYKGTIHFTDEEPSPAPQPLPGSAVAFVRNGVLQGVAYEGLLEGTWFPAISLYTHRGMQAEPASLSVNFGDAPWAFPPPQLPGCPPPQPASLLSGPRPGAQAEPAGAEGPAAAAAAEGAAGPAPEGMAALTAEEAAQPMEEQQQQQQQPAPPQEGGAAAALAAGPEAAAADAEAALAAAGVQQMETD